MSLILASIKHDLKTAMLREVQFRKEGITEGGELNWALAQKGVSRAIISMFPEIGKKPADGTDDDVIKLLKKYISQEKERLLYTDKHLTESDIDGISASDLKKLVNEKVMSLGDEILMSPAIGIAQNYLPKQASEDEIVEWVKENIDLTQYKNKMQAMGPIMKQFKGCDGNVVKGILLSL